MPAWHVVGAGVGTKVGLGVVGVEVVGVIVAVGNTLGSDDVVGATEGLRAEQWAGRE